jgi:hypothetical protein
MLPSALRELVAEDRLNELGPVHPNHAMYPLLKDLTVERAFAPFPVRDQQLAQACLAGLWLYHDFLDESHRISQDLSAAEGSYWHALMHRREPDFGNAKYWFRRVGSHPVFQTLRQEAARLAEGASEAAEFLARQPAWDPFAFVDLCETSFADQAPHHRLCREVQRVEWKLLFDYCCRGALQG